MINNRNKSVVRGMAWNTDGQRICIVYEDGAVIVGSVDGNRIWGKEIKNVTLTGVCWSPDSRLLLFSLSSGEVSPETLNIFNDRKYFSLHLIFFLQVHVYDGQGGFVSKINVQCLSNTSSVAKVVSLVWYNSKYGAVEEEQPTLGT